MSRKCCEIENNIFKDCLMCDSYEFRNRKHYCEFLDILLNFDDVYLLYIKFFITNLSYYEFSKGELRYILSKYRYIFNRYTYDTNIVVNNLKFFIDDEFLYSYPNQIDNSLKDNFDDEIKLKSGRSIKIGFNY
jgi:hypothetical protein